MDGLLHISAIKEGNVNAVSDELAVGQEIQVRVVSFDKSKRRIGLSMKPYVEGEENGRPPRRERDSFDFSSDDAELKLSEEELDALTVDDTDEAVSIFDAAFARAKFVQQMKADKKSYKASRP